MKRYFCWLKNIDNISCAILSSLVVYCIASAGVIYDLLLFLQLNLCSMRIKCQIRFNTDITCSWCCQFEWDRLCEQLFKIFVTFCSFVAFSLNLQNIQSWGEYLGSTSVTLETKLREFKMGRSRSIARILQCISRLTALTVLWDFESIWCMQSIHSVCAHVQHTLSAQPTQLPKFVYS